MAIPSSKVDEAITYDELLSMAEPAYDPALSDLFDALQKVVEGDRSPEFYHGMIKGIIVSLGCQKQFADQSQNDAAVGGIVARCAALIIQKIES